MAARRRYHGRGMGGPGLGGSPGGRARSLIYAHHVSGALARQSRKAAALIEWARDESGTLNFRFGRKKDAGWPGHAQDAAVPSPAEWERLRKVLAASAKSAEHDATSLDNHMDLIAGEMSLDPVDGMILQLFIDYDCCSTVTHLWDCLSNADDEPTCLRFDARLIASLLGLEEREVARRLGNKGALRNSGLLHADADGVRLLSRFRQMLRRDPGEFGDVRSALLGAPRMTALELTDFAHLEAETAKVIALLRGALAERRPGIVIVLYGPPGTGKTELAKLIAKVAGVPLHAIGEADEAGGEPTREERLSELQLAQRILAKAEPALLLFDEAEDLFGEMTGIAALFGPFPRSGSKAFMHRLLESGPAPMIWTANSLDAFGPAVLRRMTACLHVGIPPLDVRARLWEGLARDEGLDIPSSDLASLARRLPVAPALARSGMVAARLAGGDSATVEWAMTGVSVAMTGGRPLQAPGGTETYHPELVNADIDLAGLADRLAGQKATRAVSLMLSGPSGSGKSAFARYLAERMGCEVVEKRASDLLGKYVGETEKQIAAAFAEARQKGAFLIFDEADSLLGNRSGAHRNWEVSQVNEMLTWMERHNLPFCCTTNLMDRIDPAAMRRFLIKAKFGTLRPEQAALAFERAFGLAAPAALARLDGLTPSDFSLVRRKAELQGLLGDAEYLLSALEAEQTSKFGSKSSIGFH